MKAVNKPQFLISLQEHYSSLLNSEEGILPKSIVSCAKDSFRQHGFPTNRHEDWKYTALDKLHQANSVFSAGDSSSYETKGLPLDNIDNAIVVSVVEKKVIGQMPVGLTIQFFNSAESIDNSSLKKAIVKNNENFNQLLADDAMLALNQALCQLIITIEVNQNTVLESPIVIDYGNSQVANEAVTVKPVQLSISLAQSSQATLIEYHRNSSSQQELSLTTCTFNLEQNSQCQHYSLSNQEESNQHFWYGYGCIDRDAHLQSNALVKGEQLVRRFFCNDLHGEGAQVTVNSAYQAENNQTHDIRTLTRHLQANCQSVQLHQGLLDDQAVGVFNGMIYVDPKALKTDGQMDNNVMLLTPKAQNNSKPQLEIYADDVKCSHGFTCGSMDENQLYYMRSRGIPEALARQQILKAFVARVTENFPSYVSEV